MGFPADFRLSSEPTMKQTIVNYTDADLKRLKPGRPRILRDEACRNLFIVVSRRAVTWKFKGERRDPSKPKGWATQSATLGPVASHTVAAARAWAYGLQSKTKNGINPNYRPEPIRTEGLTLAQLWDLYAEDLRKRGKDTYNHQHYGQFLTREVGKKRVPWQLPIRDLTRDDVKALHASISAVGLRGGPSPYSANRTRECLSAALNFALEDELVVANVAKGSKRLRNKERKRNESIPLEPSFYAWWWAEVAKLSPVRAAFHSIVLLLGLRLETAMVLRWDWINLDAAEIIIPADAMKMENELWLPLSRKAVEILRSLPRQPRCPYVFAVRTRDGTAWTHLTEAKERTKRKKKPGELFAPQHPLQHAVGSKLRTAYRTAHQKLNTPHAVAEYLHGHVIKGIAAHYTDVTQMRNEFREAQEKVSTNFTSGPA